MRVRKPTAAAPVIRPGLPSFGKGEFMRSYIRRGVLLAAVLITAHSAFAQAAASGIAVRGDGLKPGSWSVDELKRQFAKEIQTVKLAIGEDKEQKSATGIPLFSLINAAELKTEKTPKHYDLSFIVIMEANDAYRVFFSLAEPMPKNGQPQVWLVWEVDGKPLSGKEARCVWSPPTAAPIDPYMASPA
jgi:hypothetical protein